MNDSNRKIDLNKLGDPFPENQIEWRVSQCGTKKDGTVWCKVLAYISARAIMDRLDDVCGPENWKVHYDILPSGVLCTLSIRINGEWISKVDGSQNTDIESFKGGISSALKRAGSVWKIGRYLYGLEEDWAETSLNREPNAYYGKTKDNISFSWLPPKLPDWALPSVNLKDDGGETKSRTQNNKGSAAGVQNSHGKTNSKPAQPAVVPRTGNPLQHPSNASFAQTGTRLPGGNELFTQEELGETYPPDDLNEAFGPGALK